MYKYFLIPLFSILTVSVAHAQKKYTLNGTIKDASTGETLIGASIKVQEIPSSGTSTNNYGFYSLTIPEGTYLVTWSFIGYEPTTQKVQLQKNHTISIPLNPNKANLDEVVIRSNKKNNDNVASPQMGLEKLNMAQINQVPVVMGERDILKTITLMPGIKSSGEGNTGFYVRGGGSDQNLILLDEATVYNASHLLGFFSTFNSDAIKDVSIFKGGMPAEYGGRLSSVLDVKMNEGNNQDFTVQGGIGLVASRLKLEGPIEKGKGSFMISARRTYVDLFLKASSDSSLNKSTLYFYDINAKANYHFNDRNAIYLSGYFGKDVLGLKDIFGTNWGNSTGTARFNHVFSSKLFSNTSFIYSNYNYVVESLQSNDGFKATSKITDLNFKQDFSYYTGSKHTLKFGLNVLRHDIAPGDVSTTGSASSFNDKHVEHRYGYESAAYVSDEWKVNSRLTLLYGLRLSGMFLLGPGTFNTYDTQGNIASSKTYGPGSLVKDYWNLEPRFSASYSLNEESSIKASYNRNTQNIHLLSNSTSSTPTDLYVMSSNNLKPEIADQVAAGYFRNFGDNTYEFSAEVYYKALQNQIDYKDGAQLRVNQDVESLLNYGTGRAYGMELFLKKKYGRFNGWFGYTLSKTERKFADINNGSYYPARQDRTHDVSLVAIYQLNKRWSFSSSFIYGTGNVVTYPTGKYSSGGTTVFSYSERNGYRQPSSNRLDLGATLEGREHKRFHSSWTFSVYNVYASRDPYSITFRDSENIPNTTEAVQTSIFAIPIPSVTWNFKF
ncbi:TonB-dependent receptor [Pedobacter frigidisoli]|uniref:TonB-dependent receptor n=1 Tax=Pedobacter frigidisoli TaxID=2530455 RepID=A0A4R0NW66_9SPHI|nr:TonB-dependent receptor [Pedobacter frigidisoli]TCD05930.1 TonB-dependent receptor [Pedobacter frigidisoli]